MHFAKQAFVVADRRWSDAHGDGVVPDDAKAPIGRIGAQQDVLVFPQPICAGKHSTG